jgi:hypothetical protein
MIAAAGHEIGNHSFHHEPWLHLYDDQQIEEDLAQAEDQIEQATGQRPIGFRGPGFSVSKKTLEVLTRRGYLYDCSTFPTFLGPLARAYYFMTANLSQEQKQQRKKLFGTLQDGLRPNKPYLWQMGTTELIEIPVTTMPFLKMPVHASYLLYLSKFSRFLAQTYFQTAVTLCRLTGVQLSFLLHPLDFLEVKDAPEIAFFPAMDVPWERKLTIISAALENMADEFTILTLRQHAQEIGRCVENLAVVKPNFSSA